MFKVQSIAAVALLIAGMLAGRCVAADLKLRAEAKPQGAVVQLSDVAEIVAVAPDQARQWSAIELFPTPTSGKRFVRLRELQDILSARGINLADCHFSGAATIAILPPTNAAAIATAVNPRSGVRLASGISPLKDPRELAIAAIVRHLRTVAADAPWTVALELTESQARWVGQCTNLQAAGGQNPWSGPQHFKLLGDAPQGPASLTVDAMVSLPSAVIVASRALPRGAVLTAGDVQLGYVKQVGSAEVFRSLDDVAGKELVRPIVAGQAIEAGWLHSPVVVHKGDLVTVIARAAGIEVRTVGRSRDDGGRGELVSVEAATDKATFFARVRAAQEVEVFAHATNIHD